MEHNRSRASAITEHVLGADNLMEHGALLTTVDMQENFGSNYYKVGSLTFDEARKYNKLLVNKGLQDWYWTCTPWSKKDCGYESSLVVVAPTDDINRNNYNNNNDTCPFCIRQIVS